MPHQHLSFQSLHGFQGNAHDDDDGGTADGQALHAASQQIAGDDGQDSNDGEVNSAEDHDLADDLSDEVGGGLAGTEA